MAASIDELLRHRGKALVAYPGAELWKAVGGEGGVAALINDLYRRIEQDELLRLGQGTRSQAAALSHEDAGRLLREVERLSDAELDSLIGSLLCDS